MKKNKHKRKKFYTVSVTTNDPSGKTKFYRARFNILRVCIVSAIIIVLIAVGLTALEIYEFQTMQSQVSILREVVDEQKETITNLGKTNSELVAQNEILNTQVGIDKLKDTEQEEIKKERTTPSGFPLTGSATIKPQDTEDEDYVPIAVFVMSDISDVVATAEGIVTSVREDSTFGKCIIIDHGNGYQTYYRTNCEPKVNEGDEVVRGSLLFIGGEDTEKMGYQITRDDEFIDPMDIIAING